MGKGRRPVKNIRIKLDSLIWHDPYPISDDIYLVIEDLELGTYHILDLLSEAIDDSIQEKLDEASI